MTGIPKSEQAVLDEIKRLLRELRDSNPLNNASIDPDLPGISAGSNVFNSAGFQFPWGGELRSMGSVATGLNSKADGIQSYAEGVQAYAEDIDARQSQKPTTLWVQARLDSLSSRIDGSAGSGDIADVRAEMWALANTLQAQINFILEDYVPKPDRHVDPPPPINN